MSQILPQKRILEKRFKTDEKFIILKLQSFDNFFVNFFVKCLPNLKIYHSTSSDI